MLPFLPLRWAALFHDIGKPSCFKQGEDGVGHFLGHDIVSEEIFHRFAMKYKMNNKTRELVEKLIWFHDKQLSSKSNKINNFLRNYGTDNLDLLFLLKEADIKGQNPKYSDRLESLKQLKKEYMKRVEENPCLSVKNLKINGTKLMKMGFFKLELF